MARELSPEQLAGGLSRGPLAPVYLVAGGEPLRVLECADAIRAAAREQGYAEREVFEVEGRDIDWDGLEASLRAPSLFAARRLIEVRLPTSKPGKQGGEVIAGYCAQPPADVCLLVTGGEWSKRHGGKWSEAIAATGSIAVAWPIKPHELEGWLEARLRKRGVRADRDAVRLLVERVEGNLLAAAQEIDKLALLAGDDILDVARMQALVADAARYDVFRLVDSALNGQGTQAVRMLAGLRAEGQAVPALMGMVVMELQRTAALARVKARGGNLGAEFKAQRIWDAKEAAYRRALERHPVARWERFVAVAGEVDRVAKGRGAGDEWLLLERLLLAVADVRAVPLLAA
ncbi:DNA polymerase III subunit delta [Luteimonas terricola]|uniref:DNA polymerase III subunit delta n=1 Tax=Luteimonas terricola TaxID=645597 RepID=A0ABQ2EE88_9GAMM|nr:DNA polymerase III subunit delta [Luteimonas terricola]GGK07345.1 DNA polymerase III subunit delta [Luteimonas terricola]